MRLRATTEMLSELAELLAECTVLLARSILEIGELEAKFLMCRHIYRDALAHEAAAIRLRDLGQPIESGAVAVRAKSSANRDILLRASATDDSLGRFAAIYRVLKPALLESAREHARRAAQVMDEPTVVVLDEICRSLADQIAEADAFYPFLVQNWPETYQVSLSAAAGAWRHRTIEPHDMVRRSLPAVPALDSRFSHDRRPSEPSPERPALETLAENMHVMITDIELVSIEICARGIIQGEGLPWAFSIDMARQCWDEARHAQALGARMLHLGGWLGQYTASRKTWKISKDEPLEMALAIQQRIGEWKGVDGAVWLAWKLAQEGDTESASIFEFITVDEITHVSLGNRWIKHLVGTDEAIGELHARALRLRKKDGKPEQKFTFPFNPWACERAGFSPAFVQECSARYAAEGSEFKGEVG